MHAVVGRVSVQSGREDEAVEYLKAEVLPRVKQAPGLVGGYWLAPRTGMDSASPSTRARRLPKVRWRWQGRTLPLITSLGTVSTCER
jgi:hypothetical protein